MNLDELSTKKIRQLLKNESDVEVKKVYRAELDQRYLSLPKSSFKWDWLCYIIVQLNPETSVNQGQTILSISPSVPYDIKFSKKEADKLAKEKTKNGCQCFVLEAHLYRDEVRELLKKYDDYYEE